jgi:hypothetical protein
MLSRNGIILLLSLNVVNREDGEIRRCGASVDSRYIRSMPESNGPARAQHEG